MVGDHPGPTPDRTLAEALREPPRLLVVDQFEELYVLCHDAGERNSFLRALTALDPRHTVAVIGLHADFYAVAAREPLLVAPLQGAQVLLAPMTVDEVREAITGPAELVGATVEDGLPDLLLSALAPRASSGDGHDPGALPMLAHALFEMWTRSRRNRLSIADYHAIGGLDGAIQQSAEEAYWSLDPPGRTFARQLFQRLITLEDDAMITRRRVARTELEVLADPEDADASLASTVLDRFAERHLLIAEADGVQVSHDALLAAWPRLLGWLDEYRDSLRLHRQLTRAATAWDTSGRDPAALLRGARLASAVEWASDPEHFSALNRTERDFIDAGIAHRDADRGVARDQAKGQRRLLAALIALVLVAGTLTAVALHTRAVADSQRAAAARARGEALTRQIAVQMTLLQAKNPALAARLALTAYRSRQNRQTRSMLLTAAPLPLAARALGPSGPQVASALSPGGSLLATAGPGPSVELWDLTDPAHPRHTATITSPSAVYSLAFSPDGRTLAAGGADKRVHRWQLAGSAAPRPLGPLTGAHGLPQSLAFSPDGAWLAAGTSAGEVDEWNLDSASSTALPLVTGRRTRRVLRRGLQPGRRDPGRRRPGRPGAPVGSEHPGPPGAAELADQFGLGDRPGLQPRRCAAGGGQCRRDRPALVRRGYVRGAAHGPEPDSSRRLRRRRHRPRHRHGGRTDPHPSPR